MAGSEGSSDPRDDSGLAASLDQLHVNAAPHVNPRQPSPNPWEDEHSSLELKPAHTPDPSMLDPAVTAPFNSSASSSEAHIPSSKDVLSEFDPLANQEEVDSHNAWASAEGNPPPPIPKSTRPPPLVPKPEEPDDTRPQSPRTPPPQSDTSPQTTPSSSSFPSLAAFARTFSLPGRARPRPTSMDGAKPIGSPSTVISFATQQQQRPAAPNSVPGSGAATPSGFRTDSPRPGKDKDPPFDFQKFLDQMKSRQADPIGKYLRSFLSNFAKRSFTVNDQVKIINDFLNFISVKMRENEIWRNASDAEFDNAMEGIEKLVMNRLYDFTFTPQAARLTPPRPITADDLERDRVLSQRIALFGWIEEKHLDIPVGEGSQGFLMFAQQGMLNLIQCLNARPGANTFFPSELLKVNHYKAPRDKLICILNSCKVIFGLIRHLHKDEGADSFLPILIFVILKANPEHLLSNVEFINRFRNPEKLQSEAGYYLSSLMGAVSFIETMDHTSLSCITQEVFERNVEDAIQSLPDSRPQSPSFSTISTSTPRKGVSSPLPASPHAGEESAEPLALPAPQSIGEDARRLLQKTGDTISKPLGAISRIFGEVLDEKLTYLPGPFAPFEIGRENRQERQQQQQGYPGQASQAQQQHWSHPDQISQYSKPPQTPIGVGESGQQVGAYGPPIQTPYKPRVRRGPPSSSGFAGMPSTPSTPPGMGYQPAYYEDTPTRPGGVPYTNQALAIGPSQHARLAPQYGLGPGPSQGQSGLGTPVSGGQGQGPGPGQSAHVSRTPTPAIDYMGLQNEIDLAHDRAHAAAKDTLVQIFPSVEVGVIELVLEANDGDLGKSIEALLEMSGGE
ncbi:hypothetical protein CONPUDRAFT_112306 [Coniophora puteana RWD-64-598 SS2]|uniref:VPS9 domain-containing protein n=1 Tax=Coniophora puteana (strain RWD-64-598) TaxID=741705 RepID=A0A5M3M854_CONPW|nr:uncharacterized protein CONPUDRAFT_112306 [Coniophora puteana RWD-64-598 SS2]EIW75054.1 hypothetical protein CONPUDRAFT_112306 [Coniophora puteana RWD-64-598 SS2]